MARADSYRLRAEKSIMNFIAMNKHLCYGACPVIAVAEVSKDQGQLTKLPTFNVVEKGYFKNAGFHFQTVPC